MIAEGNSQQVLRYTSYHNSEDGTVLYWKTMANDHFLMFNQYPIIRKGATSLKKIKVRNSEIESPKNNQQLSYSCTDGEVMFKGDQYKYQPLNGEVIWLARPEICFNIKHKKDPKNEFKELPINPKHPEKMPRVYCSVSSPSELFTYTGEMSSFWGHGQGKLVIHQKGIDLFSDKNQHSITEVSNLEDQSLLRKRSSMIEAKDILSKKEEEKLKIDSENIIPEIFSFIKYNCLQFKRRLSTIKTIIQQGEFRFSQLHGKGEQRIKVSNTAYFMEKGTFRNGEMIEGLVHNHLNGHTVIQYSFTSSMHEGEEVEDMEIVEKNSKEDQFKIKSLKRIIKKIVFRNKKGSTILEALTSKRKNISPLYLDPSKFELEGKRHLSFLIEKDHGIPHFVSLLEKWEYRKNMTIPFEFKWNEFKELILQGHFSQNILEEGFCEVVFQDGSFKRTIGKYEDWLLTGTGECEILNIPQNLRTNARGFFYKGKLEGVGTKSYRFRLNQIIQQEGLFEEGGLKIGRQVKFNLDVPNKSTVYEGEFGEYLLEGAGSILEQNGEEEILIEGQFFKGVNIDFTKPHCRVISSLGKIIKKTDWKPIKDGNIKGQTTTYDAQGQVLEVTQVEDSFENQIINYGGRVRLQSILNLKINKKETLEGSVVASEGGEKGSGGHSSGEMSVSNKDLNESVDVILYKENSESEII